MTESKNNEMEKLLQDISFAIENITILQKSITVLQYAPGLIQSDVQYIQDGVSRWQTILKTLMDAFRVQVQDLTTQPPSFKQDVLNCNRSHCDSPVRSYTYDEFFFQ